MEEDIVITDVLELLVTLLTFIIYKGIGIVKLLFSAAILVPFDKAMRSPNYYRRNIFSFFCLLKKIQLFNWNMITNIKVMSLKINLFVFF